MISLYGIKDILDELKSNVIPLFERKTNYDIIGKFYEEFLNRHPEITAQTSLEERYDIYYEEFFGEKF